MNWMEFYGKICTRLLHFMIVHRKIDKAGAGMPRATRGYLEWQELFDAYDAPDGEPVEDLGQEVMKDIIEHEIARAEKGPFL